MNGINGAIQILWIEGKDKVKKVGFMEEQDYFGEIKKFDRIDRSYLK